MDDFLSGYYGAAGPLVDCQDVAAIHYDYSFVGNTMSVFETTYGCRSALAVSARPSALMP